MGVLIILQHNLLLFFCAMMVTVGFPLFVVVELGMVDSEMDICLDFYNGLSRVTEGREMNGHA